MLPCLVLALPLYIPAMAQSSGTGAAKAASPKATVEKPINFSGIAYQSRNLRDPFWHPDHKKTGPKDDEVEISRGVPPPGIAGTYVAQAKLEGISLGMNRKTAVVRGADSRAYFLREGDRLFDGYLKTIHDDSITLIRESRMRSGKTVTQEVTKRLRTP